MLKDCKAYVFDLDGCVYRGDTPIRGAAETIQCLRDRGKRILFLTNNATHTPEYYLRKLRRMCISAAKDEVLSSATTAAIYLRRKYGRCRIYAVGEEALRRALTTQGHRLVDSKRPSFVVAGLDYHFNYQKLWNATNAIFSGARFIATNTDANVPVEDGIMPGAGAIVHAISTATGVAPFVVGKPHKPMLDVALERVSVPASKVVFVGDRIETDVQAGKRVGAKAVLVLSGATKRKDVANRRPRPDLVLPDLSYLSRHMG